MEHLINIILISLFCMGWNLIISKGMLLGKILVLMTYLPMWLAKPLGFCVPCSASIIGGIGYFLLIRMGQIQHFSWFAMCFYLLCAVWINKVLWHAGLYIKKIGK